jgi:D-alanine-D-alanine ligase
MYIGVIYCATNTVAQGKVIEELADSEVWDTAVAVKSALEKKGHQVDLVPFEANQVEGLGKYEWIFNLAETIRGFPLAEYEVAVKLEELGIPFTGSGSETLLACVHKSSAKAKIQKYGILTPQFQKVNPGEQIKTELEFPLIVKPDHEDGSIGITNDSVVQSMPELTRKISEIHHVYDQAALAEEFIEGRDITASLIGNGDDLTVLPLSEIIFSEDYVGPKILTFEEKWVAESQAYQKSVSQCPISLKESSQAEIKTIAKKLFNIFGCRDYAIVDFRLKDDVPYVIEVNPNPCINPVNSGFITAGAVYGFNYDEIIIEILNHSMVNRNKVREGWARGNRD